MKSIMQTEKRCYICTTMLNLHKHHIFQGKNRKTSENNGFTVYLCGEHHNMSDNSVHFNHNMDRKIKEECQKVYELRHTREEFMALIGRNYRE